MQQPREPDVKCLGKPRSAEASGGFSSPDLDWAILGGFRPLFYILLSLESGYFSTAKHHVPCQRASDYFLMPRTGRGGRATWARSLLSHHYLQPRGPLVTIVTAGLITLLVVGLKIPIMNVTKYTMNI